MKAVASERNYRLLFDGHPSPMWVYDVETLRFLEVNEAALKVYGFAREEFLAMTVEDIRPREQRAAFKAAMAELDGDRRLNTSGVWQHMRRDGRIIDVEITSQAHIFGERKARVVLAVDVTERLAAERAVRHLAAIVEGSHEAIIGRTLDGVVTSWNGGAEELFGYRAEEMIGRSVALVHRDGDSELAPINDRARAGERVEFEAVRRHKDGSLIDVFSTVSPIVDAEGVIIGASSISRGIGERKRAEAAIRRSEARYRDLFENATDLIATVDLDSRLTAVNESFVRTLGYSREELMGTSLRDLVPVEWHEQLERARVRKIGESLDATIYEHEFLAKNGTRIPVEVASRVIEEDGRPVGVEAICRDISERRNLEAQLRQAQRLEAIGQLAGGVAHDFNNLLTVISGYAEELLEEGDPESRGELSEIAAAAERATVLTRQLLAFSRRQVLQPRIVDLNEVVGGIMPMLTRLIGEDIDLVASLDPSLRLVRADPTQIEQVILNLAINARDAMPTGGRLTIETSNAYLDENYTAEHADVHPGPHAILAVTDSGIGMDADTAARIFEPFFTTKGPGNGTGLGLSTVYGIMKQSGGNVWVYSEPGKGSTFKVYLPADATAQAASPSHTEHISVPQGAETILVVEDEEQVRVLTANLLRKRGYTVIATGSGSEALAIATEKRDRIDLLLTDLVMPEMSGPELASQITTINPDLRVLFMSGYADEAVTRHGRLEAGSAFIEKPFSSAGLARKVRDVLDRDEGIELTRDVAAC